MAYRRIVKMAFRKIVKDDVKVYEVLVSLLGFSVRSTFVSRGS